MSHKLLRELHARPIAYLPVYRYVVDGAPASILLSHLMFILSKSPRAKLSNSDMMNETGLTVNELRAAKAQLKDLPFLIIEAKGSPPTTYYAVDWAIWETYMAEHVAGTAEIEQPIRQITKPKMDKNAPFYSRCAQHLADAISATRKINTNSKVSAWANAFRMLHTRDKIQKQRIKKVLVWYCSLLSGGLPPYTPEAYSGQTFREKFLRIENLMDRGNKSTDNKIKLSEDGIKICEWLRHEIKVDCTDHEELANAIDDYLYNLIKIVKREDDILVLRAYMAAFMSVRKFCHLYSIWINEAACSWMKNWGGSLTVFSPGGKLFTKFIKELLKDKSLSPKQSIRKAMYATK